jgi:peroxiredoxin Q/BCP
MGISFDTVDANHTFAEKFSFPFDLLCDTQRDVGLAYGACEKSTDQYAHRISYLIDKTGKIARAYEKVKPADHPQEVLRDLKAL